MSIRCQICFTATFLISIESGIVCKLRSAYSVKWEKRGLSSRLIVTKPPVIPREDTNDAMTQYQLTLDSETVQRLFTGDGQLGRLLEAILNQVLNAPVS